MKKDELVHGLLIVRKMCNNNNKKYDILGVYIKDDIDSFLSLETLHVVVGGGGVTSGVQYGLGFDMYDYRVQTHLEMKRSIEIIGAERKGILELITKVNKNFIREKKLKRLI